MTRFLIVIALLVVSPQWLAATPHRGTQDKVLAPLYRDSAEILSTLEMDPLGWGVSLHTHAATKVTTFSLDNPPRLVVDIPLGSAKAPSQLLRPLILPLDEPSCCSSIRIAAHHDKIRVVFDLASASVPQFNAKALSDRVVYISIAQPETVNTSTTQSPTHDSSPQIQAPLAVNALRILPPQANSTTAPTPSTAKTDPSAPPAPRAPQPLTPALTKIEFKGLGGGPLEKPHLKLQTSHRPHYQITKRASDHFVLRIKDCALSDTRLTLPYFPPQEVDGLNLVQSSLDGNDVVIEIKTKRNARVRSVPEERAILVFVE
jgi:hypothetical protein